MKRCLLFCSVAALVAVGSTTPAWAGDPPASAPIKSAPPKTPRTKAPRTKAARTKPADKRVHVALSRLVQHGHRNEETVRKALTTAIDGARSCLEPLAPAKGTTRISLSLSILGGGQVVGVQVRPKSPMSACLTRAVRGLKVGTSDMPTTIESTVNVTHMRRAQILGALSASPGDVASITGGSGIGNLGTLSGSGGVGGGGVGIGSLGTSGQGGATRFGITGRRRGALPTVRIEPPTVGAPHRAIVKRIMSRARARFRYCYERALVHDSHLAGRLRVSFVIEADGRVSSASTQGLGNRDLRTCTETVVRTLLFPQPRGGGPVHVTYPLVFKTGP